MKFTVYAVSKSTKGMSFVTSRKNHKSHKHSYLPLHNMTAVCRSFSDPRVTDPSDSLVIPGSVAPVKDDRPAQLIDAHPGNLAQAGWAPPLRVLNRPLRRQQVLALVHGPATVQ